jgi:urocanate hydratase
MDSAEDDGAQDFQAEVLRAYMALSMLRPEWGGALIVACGLGGRGAALALAANIAGGACLVIDERSEVCRAAMRAGACDFVVNTVDEALRALKNQVRQRKPLSVALELGVAPALDELMERGVQPELFAASGFDGPSNDGEITARAMGMFGERGALLVDFDGSMRGAGAIDASATLDTYARERGLRMESFVFASAQELRAFDAKLLATLPSPDPRYRWCTSAPRFFHRERPHRRVVFLTQQERGELTAGA